MAKKNWIKVKRGLLDPKHRVGMGIRIWLYMYMLDRADWQQGAVLEWKDENDAESFGMDVRTLRDQRQGLEASGYIKTERTGHGLRVTILNWTNPREYSGQVYNRPHVGVMAQRSSAADVSLGDSKGSPSDGPSHTSIHTSIDTPPQHLPLDSENHISQVNEDGGQPAAALASGLFRCPRCGVPLREEHRGTKIGDDCRYHTVAGVPRKAGRADG